MASLNMRKRKVIDFSEPTVAVLVGESRKIFTLHPSVLAKSSNFFQSAFSGPWMESTDKSISLPETRVAVFQSYAAYVYTGEIDICGENLDQSKDPRGYQRFHLLAELYALADVILDDKSLRNAVNDAIVDLESKTWYQPGLSAIQHAFDNSCGTTTLCRLLVHNGLAETKPEWLKAVWNKLPELYIRALLLGWAQASSDETVIHQTSTKRPRCEYHEHDDEVTLGESCCFKGTPVPRELRMLKDSTRRR